MMAGLNNGPEKGGKMLQAVLDGDEGVRAGERAGGYFTRMEPLERHGTSTDSGMRPVGTRVEKEVVGSVDA
jgi:hypothetical protein